MKKIIALALTLMMLLSFALPVLADEPETGSITINGIGSDAVYKIYKLLDLESYNPSSGAYSYKVNASWGTFFATDEAKAYIAVDEKGYATWIGGENNETAVIAFSKLALQYAKDNGIAATKSSENSGEFVITETSGKFSDLELGWYLVDSNIGSLCGLTTTNPDASIQAKNGHPTLDLQVLEDSTDQYGAHNTADIGQIVYFRATINVHAGAENYLFHGMLPDGFTFSKVSKIEHVVPGTSTTEDATAGIDYSVVTAAAIEDSTCDFEISFDKAFCDDLQTNDKVIVYFEAMLNRNAVIAGSGNPAEAWLSYGETNDSTNHETPHDVTTTYTYSFDIVKTDSQNLLLDGAAFKVYDAATEGTEIAVVPLKDKDEKPVLDKNGNPIYRRARADEPGGNIVVTGGLVTIVGFDNGTYYLEEVITPEGYNKLAARQKFIISDNNLTAVFNGAIYSTGSGVHVVNKTGSMLPETGGIGTLLFTLLGGGTVLGTGVVLVAKKRTSKIDEE